MAQNNRSNQAIKGQENKKMDMNQINQKITSIANFVISRVKQFPTISVAEQIGYSVATVGLFLTFVGLLLFILGI